MSIVFEGSLPGIPDSAVSEVESLPSEIAGTTSIAPFTAAGPGVLTFEVPHIARYLVRNGKTVELAVERGADRAAAELFLHTSARAALLHQRREIPLNAATLIAPNLQTVALCGPSATGKSTLAAALCRRGWLLVADDVSRVAWNGTAAVAWPGGGTLKLWRDACERLGYDPAKLARIRDGLEKYYVPMRSAATPSALGMMVRLRVSLDKEVLELPAARIAELVTESSYRPRWIDPLGCRVHHARIAAQIGRSCRAIVLGGARERPVEELVDDIAGLVR